MRSNDNVTAPRSGSRGGNLPIRPRRQSRTVSRIGCAEQLRFSTWNCSGLSATQKQLCSELGYDILGLTETHDTGSFKKSLSFIPAEPAPENDRASGVALLLSDNISRCIMHTNSMGSRIVYARIRAAICNIFAICIYVPHSNHVNPSRADTLGDLDKLLSHIPPADNVIIMGDFNACLPRSYKNLTGRWSIHKDMDRYGGGQALLDIMRRHRLIAASTLHQPRRGLTNATFIPRDPQCKPRQIDYILCSRRWASSVRRSRVRWGVTIQRWGRHFDHGLVECTWKARVIAPKKTHNPDFATLRDSNIAAKFDGIVSNILSTELTEPECTTAKHDRLTRATKEAIKSLPPKKRTPLRKRHVSDQTRQLLIRRAEQYDRLSPAERRLCNREISRSCRNDYRTYINNIVKDIDAAARVGNMREVNRLTKSISLNSKSSSVKPTKSSNGSPFTNNEDLLKAWHEFLGKKFACVDRPGAVYAPGIDMREPHEDEIMREEFEECVKALRAGRAPGVDETPIEVYLASPAANQELYELVCLIWRKEDVPPNLVHALFVMLYKKGVRDDLANYRAIGLLCHSYKVLSVLILRRMQPAIEQYLPDSQAGFRKARGCRDNVLILKIIIDEVVKAGQEAVASFIDYTAAFDSLSHRYLDESLADAKAPAKVRRMIRAIYNVATGAVRILQPPGHSVCSDRFDINRGAIQGDIYSPPSFTIGLHRIFTQHDIFNDGIGGPPLNCPRISKLEYADDANLLNKITAEASMRLSSLADGGSADAGLDISLKKTKVMPIRRCDPVSETTEDEIVALNLKHKCPACSRTFPTERGLKIHRARWCSPDGPERSRKGSLADKAVEHTKRVKQTSEQPRVSINGHVLENVLTFDYLGCRVSGDGDERADVDHRMNIAQSRFSGLWNIWNDHRLLTQAKIDLYVQAVCSTFTHGSEAWTLTPPIMRSVNGFNSRCLHRISGRSYRDEATTPRFNLPRAIRQRRMRWLGHILRMPDNRLVRRAVVGLAANGHPYPSGSLLMNCNRPLHDIISAAGDRVAWNNTVENLS